MLINSLPKQHHFPKIDEIRGLYPAPDAWQLCLEMSEAFFFSFLPLANRL